MRKMIVIMFFAVPVFAANIYVDGTLVDDCDGDYSIANRNCSGSDGDAYNTLQEAFTAAAAGDTVYIRAGTYNLSERVNIASKEGTDAENKITVSNYNSEEVIIDGEKASSAQYYGLIHVSSSNYIVIEGLTVQNYAQKGIAFHTCDYCEVSNVTVDNMTSDGIWFYLSDYGSISYATVKNNSASGIYIQQSDYIDITYSAIYDNCETSGGGIKMHGASHCTIDRNEVYGNRVGIYMVYQSNPETLAEYNEVTNNLVYSNVTDPENTDGIAISTGTQYNTVSYNVCYSNADDGIDASTGGGGGVNLYQTITHNICFNSGYGEQGDGNGIKVSTNSGGGHLVAYNVCFDNDRGGFDQDKEVGYAENYFYNNTAYNNTDGGFIMDAPSLPSDEDAILYNNIAYENGIADLRKTNDSAVQLSDYNFWADGGFVDGNDVHSLSGDPKFNSAAASISTNFAGLTTIDQKLNYIRTQVQNKLGLASDSTAKDAGTIIADFHNPNAGDGELEDWYGDAPDIGAYEYGTATKYVLIRKN